MDLSAPIADLVPGHRGAILAALVRLRRPVTGRELAAQAAVPPATARRIVDDLAEAGLVHLRPCGRAINVELNRDHLAAPALEQLVALRAGLIERLRAEIAAWSEPAAAAWLLGSAARGDGNRQSDVDAVVVARRKPTAPWEEQIGALAQFIYELTGNPAQVIDYGPTEFRDLVRVSNPLLRSLRLEGVELVAGSAGRLGRAP